MFVGLAFFLLGTVVGRRLKGLSYKNAVWVANPITVGVGFAIYKMAYHSLNHGDVSPIDLPCHLPLVILFPRSLCPPLVLA